MIWPGGSRLSQWLWLPCRLSRGLIDGEAIVSDDDELAIFDRIRGHGTLASATLCAFDLLQVDGRDLRREPLEARKRALAKLLRGAQSSLE